MNYIYGDFTDKQIAEAACEMHKDIHRLLLYKDPNISVDIFEDDGAFVLSFQNVLYKLGGTQTLFNDSGIMVELMATLQAAYNEVTGRNFNYKTYRKALLNAHGYVREMFEGGGRNAKSFNS